MVLRRRSGRAAAPAPLEGCLRARTGRRSWTPCRRIATTGRLAADAVLDAPAAAGLPVPVSAGAAGARSDGPARGSAIGLAATISIPSRALPCISTTRGCRSPRHRRRQAESEARAPADRARFLGTEHALRPGNARSARSDRTAKLKRLTFERDGLTNNTVVKLDGNEWIFGERPFVEVDGQQRGRMARPLAGQARRTSARDRLQRRGPQVGLDLRCPEGRNHPVRGDRPRRPVQPPGHLPGPLPHGKQGPPAARRRPALHAGHVHRQQRRRAIPDPRRHRPVRHRHGVQGRHRLPDFIQACEHSDLSHPGTIAQVGLKVAGIKELPSRVTLGAWPNPQLERFESRCATRRRRCGKCRC